MGTNGDDAGAGNSYGDDAGADNGNGDGNSSGSGGALAWAVGVSGWAISVLLFVAVDVCVGSAFLLFHLVSAAVVAAVAVAPVPCSLAAVASTVVLRARGLKKKKQL